MTIEQLENILRQYPKDAEITMKCEACDNTTTGDDILSINNTQNAIESNPKRINIGIKNAQIMKVVLSTDDKEYYENKVKSLESKVYDLGQEVRMYERVIEDIEHSISCKIFHKY